MSDPFPRCPRCSHSWHGLPCERYDCGCRTAATTEETDE